MATLRAIFAGGGTGGHLFPAIAIADEIKRMEPAADILFIGTRNKIEARVVPEKGYAFQTIWISGFSRSLRLSNIIFPFKLIVSMMQARSIIKEYQPDVVIGTGGYVSGPMLKAATMLNVPTLIQEQNSYPGVTTRMLASKVNEVHLTFERSKQFFPRTDNLFLSGNPTRADLERVSKNDAMVFFGFDPTIDRRTVLVFGGSLGAHSMNNAIIRNLDVLMSMDVRCIWQTGKQDYPEALALSKKFAKQSLWVNAFIDRMDCAYAASDVVVCRAGATTIAELTRLGKPAILVPYPHAAANHQVENARAMVSAGAAEIVFDHDVSDGLIEAIRRLLSEERLHSMSMQSKKLGKPEAAKDIAQHVINLAQSHSVAKG